MLLHIFLKRMAECHPFFIFAAVFNRDIYRDEKNNSAQLQRPPITTSSHTRWKSNGLFSFGSDLDITFVRVFLFCRICNSCVINLLKMFLEHRLYHIYLFNGDVCHYQLGI